MLQQIEVALSAQSTGSTEGFYNTSKILTRQLHVHYPENVCSIALRTEFDWDRDLEPVEVLDGGRTSVFSLEASKPFLYFKPVLRSGGRITWAAGSNELLLMTNAGHHHVYPHFQAEEGGSILPLIEIESSVLGRKHALRIYIPPGYSENTLRYYPVLYMQDGKNLFFPEEAFAGNDWQVDESLNLLDKMHSLDKAIVVGIYAQDRMQEYTQPGYEIYARAVVEEVIPLVNDRMRTLAQPEETMVIGSSLGGVVSFYMAWEFPEVFGLVACLSSTFSFKDDLIERVLSEPRRDVRLFLDSGWPEDNYEVTLSMALALSHCGYVYGHDLLHFAFPYARHSEQAWAQRLHLPLQFFSGKVSMADRGRFV